MKITDWKVIFWELKNCSSSGGWRALSGHRYGCLPEVVEMGFMTAVKIAIVNLRRKAGALQYYPLLFIST
jgi:hypothetical protein